MSKLYYVDLLPRELQYELLMHFTIRELMPKYLRYGVQSKDYSLNSFYARYINKNYWVHRLSTKLKLPRKAFIEFLNDANMDNVNRFIVNNELRPLNSYQHGLNAGYMDFSEYLRI